MWQKYAKQLNKNLYEIIIWHIVASYWKIVIVIPTAVKSVSKWLKSFWSSKQLLLIAALEYSCSDVVFAA